MATNKSVGNGAVVHVVQVLITEHKRDVESLPADKLLMIAVVRREKVGAEGNVGPKMSRQLGNRLQQKIHTTKVHKIVPSQVQHFSHSSQVHAVQSRRAPATYEIQIRKHDEITVTE